MRQSRCTYELTVVVVACASLVQAQAGKHCSMERGGWHEAPPQLKNYLINNCAERESQFPLRIWALCGTCMYIFKTEHLVLGKQLVCSSLRKTISSTFSNIYVNIMSFQSVGPGRLTVFQQKATHPGVYGLHKVNLMGSQKKEGMELVSREAEVNLGGIGEWERI